MDTKERILDAAMQILCEEGFAGTSARAIARKGGWQSGRAPRRAHAAAGGIEAHFAQIRVKRLRDAEVGSSKLPHPTR